IYSYAMRNDEICYSPGKLMERIEIDIEQQLTSTFFSAFTIVLDPFKNTLRYSNAGHPSAILISDKITLLKPSLPLLGLHQMMSSISYDDNIVPFKSGSKLILFTDGLIDAQNKENELFSMEKLVSIVERYQDLAINSICAQIIKSYNDFIEDTEITDDVCLLGIEYDS
ncbi:MAG: PP2C family protein-serine/threonine phosphatase, partial [Eubacterium sp.]